MERTNTILRHLQPKFQGLFVNFEFVDNLAKQNIHYSLDEDVRTIYKSPHRTPDIIIFPRTHNPVGTSTYAHEQYDKVIKMLKEYDVVHFIHCKSDEKKFCYPHTFRMICVIVV